MADYQRSLNLLLNISKLNKTIYTKSGLMVGLGETYNEVLSVLEDLKNVNCNFITIGQYLSPSKKHYEVKEYISPDVFKNYQTIGLKMGFLDVASSHL